MVHQHFMLIPVMTVAENIVLANEPTRAGILLDYDAAESRVKQLADEFRFDIDPPSASTGLPSASSSESRS